MSSTGSFQLFDGSLFLGICAEKADVLCFLWEYEVMVSDG